MFLVYRPAFANDLSECLHCLRDGFAYDKAARADLIAMWRHYLRTGAGTAAVVEDIAAPPGRRIRWFCFKGFVSDAYLATLRRSDSRGARRS